MLELLGIIFGGASRLVQHYLQGQDAQAERTHEAVMFDKQIALQAQINQAQAQQTHDQIELTRVQGAVAADSASGTALIDALNAQTAEAQKAGGWVEALSASVRPIVSYSLLSVYGVSKMASLYLSLKSGTDIGPAFEHIYTSFDGTLMGSIVSFWFADRSLRKGGN